MEGAREWCRKEEGKGSFRSFVKKDKSVKVKRIKFRSFFNSIFFFTKFFSNFSNAVRRKLKNRSHRYVYRLQRLATQKKGGGREADRGHLIRN